MTECVCVCVCVRERESIADVAPLLQASDAAAAADRPHELSVLVQVSQSVLV